jgi:hypothetical protein
MKGNLGKENAGRKWKMEEFQKNFLGGYPPQFAMQTPCRTGLGSAHEPQPLVRELH